MNNIKITVVGLGYIGLPIALAFSKYFDVIGYDINKDRINKLKSGKDITNEISSKILKNHKNITFTYNSSNITDSIFT